MTDGVFSLSGAVAPVDRYLEMLQAFDSPALLIDDAHGFGAIGANGRGTLEHLGLWSDKVNGDPAGRTICLRHVGQGNRRIWRYPPVQPGDVGTRAATSHYYDGASPPNAAAAGATAKALEIAMCQPELRRRLQCNSSRLRAGLRSLGLVVGDVPTPIVGLELGTSQNMRRIHDELRKAGIIVPYFAAYSGSGAAGRLRIAVFATHTDEMLDHLLDELGRRL